MQKKAAASSLPTKSLPSPMGASYFSAQNTRKKAGQHWGPWEPPIPGRISRFPAQKEPLNKCVFGALRIFCVGEYEQHGSAVLWLKLEIHKVFLRFRAFFQRKISRKIALADLISASSKRR